MAWSQDIRDKVRNGYIFDQLPLDIVAMKYAVTGWKVSPAPCLSVWW